MGQKVNTHGLRVGVIKGWDARWYANDKDFGDTLVEDVKIRKFVKEATKEAGVPKIEIERKNNMSGWMYKVNGWYPNYGSSRYQLQNGDVVEWRFTCDLGNDIGGGYAVGG